MSKWGWYCRWCGYYNDWGYGAMSDECDNCGEAT